MENLKLQKSLYKQTGIIRFGKERGQLNIKKARKQKALAFRNCEVENLDFLKYYPCLESLLIADNGERLTNIEGLKYCGNIRSLVLLNNPIVSLEPLKYCHCLEMVNLAGCQIADGMVFGRIPTLRKLYLMNNKLKEIDFVEKLYSLTELDFEHNQVSDLQPIKKLEKLKVLNAAYNNIEDFSVIKGLKNLQSPFIYTEGNPGHH